MPRSSRRVVSRPLCISQRVGEARGDGRVVGGDDERRAGVLGGGEQDVDDARRRSRGRAGRSARRRGSAAARRPGRGRPRRAAPGRRRSPRAACRRARRGRAGSSAARARSRASRVARRRRARAAARRSPRRSAAAAGSGPGRRRRPARAAARARSPIAGQLDRADGRLVEPGHAGAAASTCPSPTGPTSAMRSPGAHLAVGRLQRDGRGRARAVGARRAVAADERLARSCLDPPVAQADLAVGAGGDLGAVRDDEHGRARARRARAAGRGRAAAVTSSSSPVGSSASSDRRVVGQRDGEPGARQLAAGELRRAGVRAVGDAAALEHLVAPAGGRSPRRRAAAPARRCRRRTGARRGWPAGRARRSRRARSARALVLRAPREALAGDARPSRRRARRGRPGRPAASTCPSPTGPVTATISPALDGRARRPAGRASRRRRRGRSGRGCAASSDGAHRRPPQRVGDDPPRVDVVGALRARQREDDVAGPCGRRRSARRRPCRALPVTGFGVRRRPGR